MLSVISLVRNRAVSFVAFIASLPSTIGFILAVVSGFLIHLLGFVGLPWSVWGFAELVLVGAINPNFGYLLAATVGCLVVFWIVYFLGTITGSFSRTNASSDLKLLLKVLLSVIFTFLGAGASFIAGWEGYRVLALLVPLVNLGLWTWAVKGL